MHFENWLKGLRVVGASLVLGGMLLAGSSASAQGVRRIHPPQYHRTAATVPAAEDAPRTDAPAVGRSNAPGYIPGTAEAPQKTEYNSNQCSPCNCCPAKQEEEASCDFLMGLFNDECGYNWMEEEGLSLTGWLEGGYTLGDGTRNNVPVSFNNVNNAPMLNQLYFILAKDAATNANRFGWGFQMDLLLGADSDDASTFGGRDGSFDNDWTDNEDGDIDNYGIAMPQIYASFYAPVGNGLTVNVGHFYTIIGYEVVTAPDNFFYSHAYTMLYGEPFTHTGALASYNLDDNLEVKAGITTGWDDFENEDSSTSFLGGLFWTSDDEDSTFAYAVSSGDEETGLTGAKFTDRSGGNRFVQSIVLTTMLTDDLQYVFQSDWGVQSNGVVNNNGSIGDNEWYGVNQYLFYDLADDMRLGVNFEWFRDDDGTQVPNTINGLGNVIGANYYQARVGLNYSLNDCVLIRPELRHDWADNGARPYGLRQTLKPNNPADGGKGSLTTIGADVIVKF